MDSPHPSPCYNYGMIYPSCSVKIQTRLTRSEHWRLSAQTFEGTCRGYHAHCSAGRFLFLTTTRPVVGEIFQRLCKITKSLSYNVFASLTGGPLLSLSKPVYRYVASCTACFLFCSQTLTGSQEHRRASNSYSCTMTRLVYQGYPWRLSIYDSSAVRFTASYRHLEASHLEASGNIYWKCLPH